MKKLIIALLLFTSFSCHKKSEDPKPLEIQSFASERIADDSLTQEPDSITYHLTTTRVPMRFTWNNGTTFSLSVNITSKDTTFKGPYDKGWGGKFVFTEAVGNQFLISDSLHMEATMKGKKSTISTNGTPRYLVGYYTTWKNL